LAGQFDFDGDEWTDVSKEAKDLIKKLICKSEKRLTASEALQHPWIKKYAAIEQQKNVVVDFPKLSTLKNFDKYS
jgi:calcium-dependent protein kinase